VLSRETTITRDREGRWFHDGEPIAQQAIERAFDRWIDRAPDGRYILKNSVNWAYVRVDGAPIFVRSVSLEGEAVFLRLSDDRRERLVSSTLRQGLLDGALYCDVRAGTMSARFDRSAGFLLVDRVGGEDEAGPFLALDGRRVRPPVLEDPLTPSGAGAGHEADLPLAP
jgi:hypothetical protein